jgi:hypothetical protein
VTGGGYIRGAQGAAWDDRVKGRATARCRILSIIGDR